MQLIAKRRPNNGKWSLTLNGAAKNAIVEVRLQNTMNGKEAVHLVECDTYGTALVDYPDFGQHVAVSLRVLDENNAETVHELSFADCSDTKLVMLLPNEPKPPQPQTEAVDDGATLPHEGEAE